MSTEKNKKWFIQSVDHYHDLWEGYESLKTIELGCFPSEKCNDSQYFGLFYTGKRPKRKDVINKLLKLIDFTSNVSEKDIRKVVPSW